ncbi:globin domain-containing protein [Streptomyces sp. NPDC048623]|uniref:globin domain-containing protein n=1 Tax=Streptomyces sp. NPDC048623 TaxID=3155761 RepID=UPI00343F57DB
MLSEQSVPVVRATLPAVGGALDQITERFYAGMFTAHPELLRDLFNRGNQATGDQRKALAGSIAAFAGALLEHPDTRPDVMLSRIAHKHAALGVTSEQYKIVHENLFAAIVAVLGDAITPEVAQAWDEVYWLMANALITLEAGLYRERGVAEGDVWHTMEIAGRHEETADTVSFTLRHPDGRPAPAFRPGQYVSVQVPLPDGARQIRQYSLSTAPGRPEWRITVKRVDGDPAGEVSSWLHANGNVGDQVTVSEPFGDLVLPEGDAPLLLASAGIGSTPMLAMLDHLVTTGSTRPVTVVHADRSPADHAHREELRRLVDALPQGTLHLWYEEQGDADAKAGRADVTSLDLPEGVTAYLCGPLPFMRAVRGDLLTAGVAPADVHYEVFGPDLWLGADA